MTDRGGAALSTKLNSAPNLVIENLSKAFGGVHALDGVSFSVGAGEVHGLLGQNGSGKSTLIKILAGVYDPDSGRVSVGEAPVPLPMPPGEFSRYGIAIVHQTLGLVGSLSVTENLFVRRLVRGGQYWINWPKARRQAFDLFEQYGLDVNPDARVANLAPVERALLAIIRALHEIEEYGEHGGGLLILDEPTPFLSRADVDRLFSLMRAFAARGTSIIFVSHDVDEVLEITDRATVLRNGRIAATLDTANSSKQEFINAILGRHLEIAEAQPQAFSGAPDIVLQNLAGAGIGPLDVSLHAGEIVGLTGLIGSGYDRVPYLVYGAEKAASGQILIDGKRRSLSQMTPKRAVELGMVLIPGDRQVAGVVDSLSVAENIALPMYGRSVSERWVTTGAVNRLAEAIISRFDVRPRQATLLVRALSGGNQQKVVLGKWLQTAPRLILLDEPTQGVDVGARQQVFDLVRDAASGGATVFCASSDFEQLAAICDRVLIFSHGAITASLTGPEVTKDTIADRCFNSLSAQLGASVGTERVQ